jgi:D-alanyl-D-alanine carboxypeptidase (penicillin-binding protein 5/6)
MKIITDNGNQNLTIKEKGYLATLTLTFILSFFYVVSNRYETVYADYGGLTEDELVLQMTDNKIDELYKSLDLRASSVLIFDSETEKYIYEKDGDTVYPLASLTKIMTALVAMEETQEGEIISIPKEALSQTGDNGLLAYEKWGREDLLKFILVTSSNDGARALAMHVGAKNGAVSEEQSVKLFVEKMNQKAKSLGLVNTNFYNESGLDVDEKTNGGYGTAKEVVKIFDYAISSYPEIFESTIFSSQSFISLSNKEHNAQNTNQNTGKVAGISASKTGFTSLSGGNLIISFKKESGNNIIVLALGSTFTERFSDIEKLSSTTLKIINEVQL